MKTIRASPQCTNKPPSAGFGSLRACKTLELQLELWECQELLHCAAGAEDADLGQSTQVEQGWVLSTGNNCWQDVFCSYISLNTFLLSVLISVSHHAMVCVDECFQGMVKKEGNHQFCDLVRGTEEFKTSGSKGSSAIPFPCVNSSMNASKKQNIGQKSPASCAAGGIPFPLCLVVPQDKAALNGNV